MSNQPKFGLSSLTRREFLAAAGIGTAGLVAGKAALAASLPAPSKSDLGVVKNGKVTFPNTRTPADVPGSPPPAPLPDSEKIGFAIVALGKLSIEQILPAFGASEKCKVTALVSGTPAKAKLIAKQYNIPEQSIYSYDNFEQLKDNPDVQAVYIVLPNAMHREFTERAAKIGKHVLCEKPMATNAKDARAMITACEKANVKLMIAYRCQYEPYNKKVIELAQGKELGKIRFIEAINTQSEGEPDQWRMKRDISGGGALPDIGIYCLNAARYLTDEEPNQVFAYMSSPQGDKRFAEVEERMSFMLRFPSDVVANCVTSYDAHDVKDFHIQLEKGAISLNGAFEYKGKQLLISRRSGDVKGIEDLHVGEKNQFALEMDHFSECVKDNKTPKTDGAEGLKDHVIMEALYKSAETGKPINL